MSTCQYGLLDKNKVRRSVARGTENVRNSESDAWADPPCSADGLTLLSRINLQRGRGIAPGNGTYGWQIGMGPVPILGSNDRCVAGSLPLWPSEGRCASYHWPSIVGATCGSRWPRPFKLGRRNVGGLGRQPLAMLWASGCSPRQSSAATSSS